MIGGDKTALKRQLTLSAQGENFEVHAVEKQLERGITLPGAQKQTRVNSHEVEIAMPNRDGLQVVGQGYSQQNKSEMEKKSTGQQK